MNATDNSLVSYFDNKKQQINDFLIGYGFCLDEATNKYKKDDCIVLFIYTDSEIIPKGISIQHTCSDIGDDKCYNKTIYSSCQFCLSCLGLYLVKNKIIKLNKINIADI